MFSQVCVIMSMCRVCLFPECITGLGAMPLPRMHHWSDGAIWVFGQQGGGGCLVRGVSG